MLPRRTITDAAEKGGVHQDAISSRLSRAQDHSSPARVAIVSVANDLHALAVADLVRQRETDCVLVECNRVSSSSPLSWSSDPGSSFLTTSAGPVAVSAIDVVWWRRVNAPQLLDADADAVHKDLVNNDSRSSLRGTLLTDFTGTWVSAPAATDHADNKLVQLRVASSVGFNVPRTLVSNDPVAIREFCAALDGDVVIKAVHGSRLAGTITTQFLTPAALDDDDSMRICPTIYQQHIHGDRHVRAHVFGDRVEAALLTASRLDWRSDLTTPMVEWTVPQELADRLRTLIAALGLKMGVVDLKVPATGDPVFLEVNSQGQFLFVEALTKMPLSARLAEYLCAEANAVKMRASRTT